MDAALAFLVAELRAGIPTYGRPGGDRALHYQLDARFLRRLLASTWPSSRTLIVTHARTWLSHYGWQWCDQIDANIVGDGVVVTFRRHALVLRRTLSV